MDDGESEYFFVTGNQQSARNLWPGRRFGMMLGFALFCLLLSGCTDPNSWSEQSDSDENEPDDALVEDVPVEPFSLKYGPKTFRFSWLEDDQATHYRLLENPDGVSGFTQIGLDLPAGTLVYDHAVTLYRRVNARYLLQRCRDTECETHGTLDITNTLKAAIGYFKASHIGEYHFFGISVAISGDGTTLAVGAYGESGSGTGIDPVADALAENAGAVFVFKLEDGAWVQQAYIKSFNTRPWDEFGRSVALSDDGNVLAVGAMFEYSPGTGINPPFTAAGFRSGAVYVYERTGDSWAEQTYIKAGHQIPGNPTYYGISVDLSADGSTLVVGASGEPSEVHGINPVPSGYDFWSGAAFVYQRNAGTWVQEAFIKSSATNPVGGFGRSVSLNGDGNILAVGGDGNTVHVYSRGIPTSQTCQSCRQTRP